MGRFRVRLLSRAQADVDAIYAWLRARSVLGAQNWLAAFEKALKVLESDPSTHDIAIEPALKRLNIQDKLFKTDRGRPYRILYLVLDEEIRIVRVRGPGQPPLRRRDIDRSG